MFVDNWKDCVLQLGFCLHLKIVYSPEWEMWLLLQDNIKQNTQKSAREVLSVMVKIFDILTIWFDIDNG